jgi:cold shock CspA family protein
LTGPVDGVVAEFDDRRGLGTITTGDGTTYIFHCTQIADGTRSIANGTRVVFDVRPGGRGQWEATAISPRPRS